MGFAITVILIFTNQRSYKYFTHSFSLSLFLAARASTNLLRARVRENARVFLARTYTTLPPKRLLYRGVYTRAPPGTGRVDTTRGEELNERWC